MPVRGVDSLSDAIRSELNKQPVKIEVTQVKKGTTAKVAPAAKKTVAAKSVPDKAAPSKEEASLEVLSPVKEALSNLADLEAELKDTKSKILEQGREVKALQKEAEKKVSEIMDASLQEVRKLEILSKEIAKAVRAVNRDLTKRAKDIDKRTKAVKADENAVADLVRKFAA